MKRREQAEAMRTSILDAARRAFAEHGFAGTKLRDIAKRVGITQPLIHHYFESKTLLFDAVVLRATAQYDELQHEQWGRAPDDVRFFTEGLRVLFSFVGEQREIRRLFRWAQLEGRLPDLPDAGEVDAKVFAKFAAAQNAGILRSDLPVTVALLLIDGTVVGFWDRIESYPESFGDPDPLVNGLIDALLQAMLSPDSLAQARTLLER